MSKNYQNKIRVRIKGYDARVLDDCIDKIVNAAKGTNARIAGPIPLPTKIERFTVLRSPHVDKKSREQFEIRTHIRLLDIIVTTSATVEALQKLSLSSGIEIQIN